MDRHKLQLAIILTFLLFVSTPWQLQNTKAININPRLAIEAAFVTRLADGHCHWLCAVEIGQLSSLLQNAVSLKQVPRGEPAWSHQVGILTERGRLDLLVEARTQTACFAPGTTASIKLPASLDKFLASLEID